jgi:hypothetical protein
MPPAAVTVSDRTCAAVFGVPWRSMRTFCQEHGVQIHHIGRRPVVAASAVIAALEGDAAGSDWSEADLIARIAAGGRR